MKKIFLIIFLLPIIAFSQLQVYEDYIPSKNLGNIYHRTFYSLSFIDEYRVPEWTIYMITKDRLNIEERVKRGSFRIDKDIKSSAQLIDYKRSGYDRGHLVPAADMAFDNISMRECNYMSNITPQSPNFNRGVWRNLESKIRNYVRDTLYDYDSLIIITGIVLPKNRLKNQFHNIIVPSHYYKIIADMKTMKSTSFMVPHFNSEESHEYYCTSINQIEKRTGINFFSQLPDSIENIFESSISNEFSSESFSLFSIPCKEEKVIEYSKEIPLRKIALIIGNSDYDDEGLTIQNPVNDAKLCDSTLRSIGFETILKLDLDLRSMIQSIDVFKEKIKDYDFGIIYYAGHGFSDSGKSYLIPTEFNIENSDSLSKYAYPIQNILHSFTKLLVIFDACRTNIKHGVHAPNRFTEPDHILFAFSTKLGKIAQDHSELDNSIYTYFLNENIKRKGSTIDEILYYTWQDVYYYTEPEGIQSPNNLYGNLVKKIVIN